MADWLASLPQIYQILLTDPVVWLDFLLMAACFTLAVWAWRDGPGTPRTRPGDTFQADPEETP